MGRLIRSMDWSATPLGPIKTWPQSLRTAVSLCVASSFPIAIVWGPEHVLIYNDSYWPICGRKHPTALGQDYTVCWESAWPFIGDAFTRGYTGQAAYIEDQRLFVDRNGFMEETFFTFSYSPIRDESGGVGGLFHPVTEQTDRILSERRARLLSDLATRAGSLKTTDEIYTGAIKTFAEHPFDLPYTLLYRLNEFGTRAELAGHTGLPAGSPASPQSVELGDAACWWPITEALNSRSTLRVQGLADRLAPHLCGPYSEPPDNALIAPIFVPGMQRGAAVLIAGVSSRLQLNQNYQDFYNMLAASVTAYMANAWNYELEKETQRRVLEQSNRDLEAFAYIASHDLKAPLRSITHLADWIAEDMAEKASPLALDYLETLKNRAIRLQGLLEGLLDYSQISSDTSDVEAIEIDELIDEILAAAPPPPGFTVTCLTPDARLRTRRTPLRVVLDNLIANAYRHHDRYAGTVTISVHPIDGGAEFRVTDDGPGIKPRFHARIFEIFRTLASRDVVDSTGLGLAIVKKMVEVHGGQVRIESTPPRRGASFIFTWKEAPDGQ